MKRYGFLLLLPLAMAADDVAPISPMELRGTHYIVYSVKAGETVTFVLTARLMESAAGALPTYEALDHESLPAVPKTPFAEHATVSCKAKADGLNALVVAAGRHWVRVDAGARPTMICARRQRPLHFKARGAPVYFLVPKEAKRFDLLVTCPDKREGATVRVVDPDGKTVAEETDWFHEERSIRVEAPPGHRGRVWSFVADDPRKKGHPYAADDVIVSFSDAIPPFVSTDPTALTTVLLAAGEVGTEQLANAD